ncbi:MAG: amidohydrolase family protein [Clostridia bacterium]|nr:amidohydrolase family protein [Clostridia bacterium]
MKSLVIRKAKIFDGKTALVGLYDILIERSIIKSVTPYSPDADFTEAESIDAEGKTVLPGLIDLHVHLTWNGGVDPAEDIRRESPEEHLLTTAGSAMKYLAAGITSVRDLGSPEDAAIFVDRAIKAGKFIGPRIFASGQSIIMTGGHDPFHGIMADGPWEVLKAVRRQVAQGASVIKISATGGVYGRVEGEGVDDVELRQEEVDMIVDEAHRRNVKVTAHAIGEAGIRGCLKAGIDCIEHGHCITEDMAAEMRDKNVALVPTIYIYQHLSSSVDVPEYARKKSAAIITHHGKALKWCHEAGVLIGAGSDAGSPYSPHPSLLNELYALENGGLSREEVLAAATGNAAKIIGVSGQLGTIKEGFLADLIVVGGDPLTSLSVLGEPEHVVKNGEVIF